MQKETITYGRSRKSKKPLIIGAAGGAAAVTVLIIVLSILLSGAVYLTASSQISSFIKSGEFVAAALEEKIAMMDDELQRLVEDGLLQDDSIFFDDEQNIFFFSYDDGSFGGVDLSDDDDALTDHNPDESDTGNEDDNSDDGSDLVDMNGCIFYGLGYPDVYAKLEGFQADWSSSGLETNIEPECTVSLMQTELAKYNYVSIALHGSLYDDMPVICLQEAVTEDNAKKYKDDIENNRIAIVTTIYGDVNYWIMPDFIRYYYGEDSENNFDNTVVWLSCCYGFSTEDLVSAFSDCGAKVVTGYTSSVFTYYDSGLQDCYVHQMMRGSTAEDALQSAQDVYGEDDYEWAESENVIFDKEEPAECRIYTGEENTFS